MRSTDSGFFELGICNRILLSQNERMYVGRCGQLCGQCAPTHVQYTQCQCAAVKFRFICLSPLVSFDVYVGVIISVCLLSWRPETERFLTSAIDLRVEVAENCDSQSLALWERQKSRAKTGALWQSCKTCSRHHTCVAFFVTVVHDAPDRGNSSAGDPLAVCLFTSLGSSPRSMRRCLRSRRTAVHKRIWFLTLRGGAVVRAC